MVRHKRHITHDHRMFGAADNSFRMVNHHIHCYGQSVFVAQDDHAQTIADQDDGDIAFIDDFRRGIIVSGKHGDFLALLLHFADVVNRNAFDLCCHIEPPQERILSMALFFAVIWFLAST